MSIFLLYQHQTLLGQYVWMIATVFCFGAANTATHVYASELSPGSRSGRATTAIDQEMPIHRMSRPITVGVSTSVKRPMHVEARTGRLAPEAFDQPRRHEVPGLN